MKPNTQSEIEKKIKQNDTGTFDPKHLDEWTLNLDKRKALFHPQMKQWLWFDGLHQEWVLAGCGAGEAILMSYQKMGGMKKLPQPGVVDDWCIYYSQNEMHSPILIAALHQKLLTMTIPLEMKIWSTRAVEWLNVVSTPDQGLDLVNPSGQTILQVNPYGQFID
jgi:hypothetical protein